MEDKILYFGPEDYEIIDIDDYVENPSAIFDKLPEIAKPLIGNATGLFSKVEKLLYSAPAFINAVRASIPEEALQAILSPEQKKAIAKGVLKLMTKKDGSLMATLVNPETNKIVATVPLKAIKLTPELSQAMTSFTSQMQMAQIAEQIQYVQLAIEDVRKGQESDRLAIAYSCQQKLLQAREIDNSQIKTSVLLQVISDAEDSRNLLMLSQKSNVKFIEEQPESTMGKFFKGEKTEKIESRMFEIRDGLRAINMVSLSAAMAYTELGEEKAAQKSLEYFGDFIKETYLSIPDLVQRLDMIDPSPINYWSEELPKIENTILSLPINTITREG